jgi:hypothetical protein
VNDRSGKLGLVCHRPPQTRRHNVASSTIHRLSISTPLLRDQFDLVVILLINDASCTTDGESPFRIAWRLREVPLKPTTPNGIGQKS